MSTPVKIALVGAGSATFAAGIVRDLLLLYLLNDPRTQRLEQAEALLDEWLANERNGRVARLFGVS